MGRIRVSTTVDADALQAARRRVGGRDSELFDHALAALLDALDAVDAVDARAEQGVLAAPYDDEPDLDLPPLELDDTLADEAHAPADVVELASRRRTRRAR